MTQQRSRCWIALSCMHPVSWLPAALPACSAHTSTYLDLCLTVFLTSHSACFSYLLHHFDSLPLPLLSFMTCLHHHRPKFLACFLLRPSHKHLLFSFLLQLLPAALWAELPCRGSLHVQSLLQLCNTDFIIVTVVEIFLTNFQCNFL